MNTTAREKAYLKLKELNLVAPIYKKAVAQKKTFVACHVYKLDPLTTTSGTLFVNLRGDNGITLENESPCYHSWEEMVDHLDKKISKQREYIHENSNFDCCEGWCKIEFDLISECYTNNFEERLDEYPEVKAQLEKVNGVWQTKESFLDMSDEMKKMKNLLNSTVACEYAITLVALS